MILLKESNCRTRMSAPMQSVEEAALNMLNEVYFGEKPIDEISRRFSKFRAKWVGRDYNGKVNYDPDLILFNRAVEERFGYKRFSMTLIPTYDYNAAMYDVGYLVDDKGLANIDKGVRVDKSGNGFKYNAESAVTSLMVMYFGMISDSSFTDRELIGICLHEIGHSFFHAMIGNPGLLSGSSAAIQGMKMVNNMAKNSIDNGETETEETTAAKINNVGFLGKIRSFFSGLKGKNNFMGAVHNLSSTIVSKMKTNVSNKYYSYTNEKFADSFASMYGYGADVQTALQKMSNLYEKFYPEAYPKKNPGKLSIILGMGNLSLNNTLAILLNVKDEHPDGLTRIKTQIDFLNNELKNTELDPKMKMDLMKQLEEQKKLIDDYLTIARNPETRDIYKMYYAKLYEKYGGDVREKHTDNDALFQMIDDRYKNILKESIVEYRSHILNN